MFTKKLIAGIIFLFCVIQLSAQSYDIAGRVLDENTKKPLAFVNIVINDSPHGGTSDIDGKFSFHSSVPIEKLRFSYVGYQQKIITVHQESGKNLKVFLAPDEILLDEVLIEAGENPAHRIILNAVANRDNNNPKKLETFSYTAYDKFIIKIDTSTYVKADSIEVDSSHLRMREFVEKQEIFMMENVTERKFMAPSRDYERVTATRVSGFKDPIFVFLLSQIQSTSFYEEIIHIADKNYINPISKGSTGKYFFSIEDTTYTEQNDSVFIISFKPRKGKNFDAMQGVLSINNDGWAIQNVRAWPFNDKSGLSIKIQQLYERMPQGRWFPVQLNTDIYFNNVEVNSGNSGYKIFGEGRSYLKDIELNPELVKSMFSHIEVEVAPDATHKEAAYWDAKRSDSLNAREERTYEFMDSLGKAENFDKMASTFESLFRGNIKWGKFDIPLQKILGFNDYEGLRLGFGLQTNPEFSEKFSLGAYTAYGFGDQRFKYGFNGDLLLNRYRQLKIKAHYNYDLLETGGVSFPFSKQSFFDDSYLREFLIKRFDFNREAYGGLSFRMLRYMEFEGGLKLQKQEPLYIYAYQNPKSGLWENTFNFTEMQLGFRYAFREKFMVTTHSQVSLGTKFPIVWFLYSRGLDDVADGGFAYNKFELQIKKSFFIKYIGKSSFLLRAGYIDGDVPYNKLFNGNGSYRAFTLFAPNSFATMRMNEFVSSRYIALYYTHNFGKLLLRTNKFEPEFLVATNIAWGDLDGQDISRHQGVSMNSMEKGYFESGLLINKLLDLKLYNLGLGAFYRYGPYGFDDAMDNFAVKISIVFPLNQN